MTTGLKHSEGRRVEALLAFGRTVDPKELFPTLVPGAADFVLGDPYAFALATSLDRGTKADIIWTIPYYIHQKLGHLDPHKIDLMSPDRLLQLYYSLPHRPRYVNDAPRTTKELTSLVIRRFGGDAGRIWQGRSAAAVNATFRGIYGVGPGIASMAVILIEKAFGIRFSDLDRPGMDIKADVHTMRVLYRLGLAPSQDEYTALATARRLNPAYPGELDAPLWVIGRRWCQAYYPKCSDCWMRDVCPKKGV